MAVIGISVAFGLSGKVGLFGFIGRGGLDGSVFVLAGSAFWAGVGVTFSPLSKAIFCLNVSSHGSTFDFCSVHSELELSCTLV